MNFRVIFLSLFLSFFHLNAIAAKKPLKAPPPPTFEPCATLLPGDAGNDLILRAMNNRQIPIMRTSIPLTPFLEKMGLAESLMAVVPITKMEDINLTGDLDPSKVKDIPSGMYPIENFAVSDTAQTVAMTIHRTYFTDKDYEQGRTGHLFVAKISAGQKQLIPMAEIELPREAQASNVYFAAGDRFLIVEGTRNEDQSFTSDLYFYDLSGGKPKLLHSLSQKLSSRVRRIARLATPLASTLAIALELIPTVDGDPNFAAIHIDLQSLAMDVLVQAAITFRQAQMIDTMQYDDERAGYMVAEDSSLKFVSGYHQFEISRSGKVMRESDADRSNSQRRARFAPWLLMEQKDDAINLRNELTGKAERFPLANALGWGSPAPVNGGYVFEERSHPNYQVVMLRDGKSPQTLSSHRLIHLNTHSSFLVGTSDSRGSRVTIEIIPY